ncbi:hypothetical protein CONPUDRAFT_166123 [Coniophora puteana RWD-64-598 SS2]|uniref:DUF6534 domain-containing protein n=1 Tax=Coniophora puteana (strain RWD-64-598) TaxID=741705 RepID=A0A5M3MPN8_CONPW|nr:uncharacterized protein CONPUDRAFT_166123 [Coniophora puteana RWD-64-598 SS2]EIW80665.1 hypothetical protein CONPUDRAFT_166123 [Coniophora puteana RWD-64-598 SS2]
MADADVDDGPIQVNVASTVGALFYGYMAAMWLYGIACSQSRYFMKYSLCGGKLELKLIVVAVWALETLHFLFFTIGLYGYLVRAHGSPAKLAERQWSICGMMITSLAIASLVQYVWMRRIWNLSKGMLRLFLSGCMIALTLSSWVVGALWTDTLVNANTWTKIEAWMIITPLACSTANDIIAATFLCVKLQRSKTGIRSTDGILNELIVLSLNTGLLISILSVVVIVLILVIPLQEWYVSLYIAITRLYANSLLAMLNYGVSPTSHTAGRLRRIGHAINTDSGTSPFELTTIALDFSLGEQTVSTPALHSPVSLNPGAQCIRSWDTSGDTES